MKLLEANAKLAEMVQDPVSSKRLEMMRKMTMRKKRKKRRKKMTNRRNILFLVNAVPIFLLQLFR